MRTKAILAMTFVLAACEGTPNHEDTGDDGTDSSSSSETSTGTSTGGTGDDTTGTSEAPTSTTGEPEGENSGWSIRDDEPYGRAGHTAIYDELGDRMIVFGGGANDTWELPFSGPNANQWSQLVVQGEHPPVHAYGSSFFTDAAVYDPVGQRMIVLLNPTPTTAAQNDEVALWELSLSDTPKWRRLETAGPDPGAEVQSGRVVLDRADNRLFVVGGALDETGVWTLSLGDTPTWTRLADTPPGQPGAFYTEASLLLDPARGQLVFFGGHPRLQQIWGLSLATAEWQLLDEGGLVSGSYGSSAVLDATGDRIIFFGGDQYDTVNLFSLDTHVWTATNAGGPGKWTASTSGVVDPQRRRVVYFGGLNWQSDGGEYVNTTWAFLLDELELTELIPATRRGDFEMGERAAVWDPERGAVIAFGGALGETMTHGLSPADAWVTAAAGKAPTDLWASAIYDSVGQAIVTFGGRRYVDSNAVMRLPSSPGAVWETLDVDGAPPARTRHVAVYDPVNQRMLVHGGVQDGEFNNDVYLDDVWELSLAGPPVWTQLAPSGHQPAVRRGHVAVYDSQERRMIMFGGTTLGFGGQLTDVWSLALDGPSAWTRLMPAGASPGSTDATSAVYDPAGDRMILVSFGSGAARVFALELDEVPRWHEFCSPGLTPAPTWGSFGTTPNAVLVEDGLFVTLSGGALRFDLTTDYCD